MAKVEFWDDAEVDVLKIGERLALDRRSLAKRFVARLKTTTRRLARVPTLGSPTSVEHPTLSGSRVAVVDGFPSWLVVYRATEAGIEVVRVVSSNSALTAWLLDNTGEHDA